MFALGGKKMLTTNCPSYSLWYDRFMMRFYKQVGEVLVQDRPGPLKSCTLSRTTWSHCGTVVKLRRKGERWGKLV